MTQTQHQNNEGLSAFRLGYYVSIFLSILTLITFAIAFTTLPITGPFCKEGCIEYPYSDIISRFPRDYIWMYPTILLNIVFVVFMVCIHQIATKERKIYSQLGLIFAIISAGILITNYFIQVTVIQPSIENGETVGIALLTQYNPHGIFIALEEIGLIVMSLSFLFMGPVFSKRNRLERAIRSVFIISFGLTVISFIAISMKHGIHREYFFECAEITINWFVLIVNGILLGILYKKALKQ
jgi:hypothetical protein